MPAEAHSVGASKDRPRRGGRLRRNCWGGSPQRLDRLALNVAPVNPFVDGS